MAHAEELLERMRSNPRDWRIDDVIGVCSAYEVGCTPPRNGPHYKIRHQEVTSILTIPAHRPLKPVYIRELVRVIGGTRRDGR